MTQYHLISHLIRFFRACIALWDTLLALYRYYYKKIELVILEGEESERYRIKKSILFYHCYLSIIFYLTMPIFNSQASKLKSLGNIVSAVCQISFLRGKNYDLIGNYVYLHAILNVFLQYFTEAEPLTIIGQILANQHMFFLFPEGKLLSKIYTPLVLLLVRNMQNKLLEGVSSWDFNPLELSVISLKASWPLIYLFHHFGAENLTSCYRLALIRNMEIQSELKTTLQLLEKTNDNLKNALQSRELFIASVSHELRNPLNCMIGNIELLRLDIKNEKWLKMLDTCKICSEVLLGQINNVLDVAKINAEKLELHYVPGNFYRLIEKVWNITAIPIKQKRLRGELKIASNFPKYIEMDSHRITQILLNLVGNASKFAKEGFISVTVTWHQNETLEDLKRPSHEYTSLIQKKKKRPSSDQQRKVNTLTEWSSSETQLLPTLEFEDSFEKDFAIEGIMQRDICPKLLSQVLNSDFIYSSIDDVAIDSKTDIKSHYEPHEKGIIKIEVIDTGCGMSSDALKGLFQPFKQADSSITRQFGGTGLGLYITKQLVQKMGGEIYAYSERNVGSDFCVLIPTETASQEDAKEEDPSNASREGSTPQSEQLRALIADDLPDNQTVLSRFFEKFGVQTDVVSNGVEAVEMFKAKGPNYYGLITMDLQMPKMDGLSATRHIRKHEQLMGMRETPIIVITGNCAETEKNKCVDPQGEIRAYGFFRKPFTFDECRSVVQAVMNERRIIAQKYVKTSPKVLIVDDDPFNTRVSQEYLEKHGFECTVCNNGKEAITVVKKTKFDFILMDCEMPEMDGCTATRSIKRSYPDIPILGVTGHRREECIRTCQESGMFDVETKPMDFKKVVSLINRMCSMQPR